MTPTETSTGLTDPRKNKTTATYEKMDRLESETDPLGKATHWVYDGAGLPIEMTDRRGLLTTLEYDPLGRMTNIAFGVSGKTDQSAIAYTYDNGNRLTKTEDSATGTYKLAYNELNQLTEVNSPNGIVSYAYDAAGRRTEMTAPGQEPVKYTYDEANRLTELTRGAQAVSLGYNTASEPTASNSLTASKSSTAMTKRASRHRSNTRRAQKASENSTTPTISTGKPKRCGAATPAPTYPKR